MRNAALCLCLCLGLAAARASPAVQGESPRSAENDVADASSAANEESLTQRLHEKCSRRDEAACLMLKLVTYMNRLLKKSSIGVGDSVVITQTAESAAATYPAEEFSPLSRSLPDDASDEARAGLLVADKLWNFVRSRSLKWSVSDDADVVVSATPDDEGTVKLGLNLRAGRAIESGRGKMKNMGPLLAAGMMKVGMVGILAFKALVLLVGKALLVSKLAFLLAAIIGLKKLLSQEKHVTYEVVAHPHHSHSDVHVGGGGGHHDAVSSGWGRSADAAQRLAYSAHAPSA